MFALLCPFAIASCAEPARVEVEDAWARDTIGGTASAAVFMTIRSPTPDRLLGASTPVAKQVDLMTMTGDSEAMAMEYLDAIDIPAGQPVFLDPAGLHVWLAELHGPLRNGTSFPLVLQFEKAGTKEVRVAIISPAAAPPM